MDKDRKQILASCLDVVAGISDKEYQKRVWIRGEWPEVDDFDETACNFFQDGGEVLEEYKNFGIANLPQEFIDSPEWEKIMNLAKEILEAFNYKEKSRETHLKTYTQKFAMDRKQIMETLMRIVEHISDKEYQERVWIRGEGPEVDDFDETVCHFYQEGDGVLEKYKDFKVTETQYQLLKKFRNEFKAFSDANDLPQEFIDTPEWEKIMNLAKEVLRAFNYKEKSNQEL